MGLGHFGTEAGRAAPALLTAFRDPDPDIRQHMLREACRVTRRMALVSFHHPLSFTFARRCVKRLFTGDWNIADITHWRLAREAAACGLEMVETRSFGKYRSINWFAYLAKVG